MKAKHPTQTAIAAALGVVPSRVVALRVAGMPCDSIEAAVGWYRDNIRPMPNRRSRTGDASVVPDAAHRHRRAHRATDTQPSAYLQARVAREVYEAKLAQLRYEVETGRLVNREALRAELIRRVIATRDRLLQVPDRLAPVLLGETDPARVRALIDGELRAALAEFRAEDEKPPDDLRAVV